MIFPLAKGDEAKIAEMVRLEKVQEKIAGNLPIVRLVEDFKGINKTPSIWVKLGRSDIKPVHNLELEIGKRKIKANVAE